MSDQSTAHAVPRSCLRQVLGAVGRVLAGVARGVLAAGPATLSLLVAVVVVIRLTLMDRAAFLAPLYYAAPPPALTLAAAAAAVGWWVLRRRWLAGALAASALACAGWTWATMWQYHPPRVSETPAYRVVFWNVARGVAGWQRLAATLRRHDPDVVILSEAAVHAGIVAQHWAPVFPQHKVTIAAGGLALLSRLPIERRGGGPLGDRSYGLYQHVVVHFDDVPLHIIQVDIHSHPLKPRWVPLRALRGLLDTLDGERVLVVGDFNTPSESFYFRPLRQHFRNAFEVAGRGYAATWPMPVPLLAIDQAWASEEIDVLRCEHVRSWLSDHALLVLDIALPMRAE
ncbi:MAG: endonuclease/exonuclease/phosphatase family protein [Phycisphaerales bacterium]|nr:endonuclease/exonuclease/phosphatase family protein [Phycisphaerales bacterium]